MRRYNSFTGIRGRRFVSTGNKPTVACDGMCTYPSVCVRPEYWSSVLGSPILTDGVWILPNGPSGIRTPEFSSKQVIMIYIFMLNSGVNNILDLVGQGGGFSFKFVAQGLTYIPNNYTGWVKLENNVLDWFDSIDFSGQDFVEINHICVEWGN